MTDLHAQAARALAVPMAGVDQAEHGAFLRAVIDVAAGGLLIIEGGRETAETLFRAGDVLVGVGE